MSVSPPTEQHASRNSKLDRENIDIYREDSYYMLSFNLEKISGLIIIGLIIGLLPSFVQASPPPQDDDFPTVGGDHVVKLTVEGRERLYLLHIPLGYDANQAYPLIVSLHEYGENPVIHAEATTFSDYANQEEFIIAYPAGTGDPLGWYTLADAPDDAPDNIQFMEMLVEDIQTNLTIDTNRLFLVGHSNGGGMAHRIACDAPELFSAVAIVAGWHPIDQDCNPTEPVSILALHGQFDELVPYAGDETAENIPTWAENWAKRNDCDIYHPTGSGPEEAVKTVQWQGCAQNTEVAIISIGQGRHAWADGITAVILSFFNEHSRANRTTDESEHSAVEYVAGDNEGVVFSKGTVRHFDLHLPEGYSPDQTYPLVISIHGYSGTPLNNRYSTRFSEKADAEDFIVVYPKGREDTSNRLLGWYSRPSPYEGFSDDVGFISDMITHLEETLPIDSSRIYATGISNGGGMSYRLACDLADRITAIAPVAGAYSSGDDCNPTRPVPVLAIHGRRDSIVGYDGIEGVSDALPAWAQNWADRNSCEEIPATTQPEDGLTVDTWTNCAANSIVHLYSYDDLGHQWHGNATDIIWEFFSEQHRIAE